MLLTKEEIAEERITEAEDRVKDLEALVDEIDSYIDQKKNKYCFDNGYIYDRGTADYLNIIAFIQARRRYYEV